MALKDGIWRDVVTFYTSRKILKANTEVDRLLAIHIFSRKKKKHFLCFCWIFRMKFPNWKCIRLLCYCTLMKASFSKTINSLLFCLHSWVILSNAICWQKYGRVSHTIQKLGQKIRNVHVIYRLKAKDPASVKGLKLIFRERMHENYKNICLTNLQTICVWGT